MSKPLSQTQMLIELEQVVEENLDRHLKVAKEWFPHECRCRAVAIGLDAGRDFAGRQRADRLATGPEPASAGAARRVAER